MAWTEFLLKKLGIQSQALNMGGNKITALANPDDLPDAVNLGTVLDLLDITLNFWIETGSLLASNLVVSEDSDTDTVSSDPQTLSILHKSTVANTPTPLVLKPGTIIGVHFDAKQDTTTGYQDCTLQAKLYYVDADGTSNKTQVGADSDISAILTTTQTNYELHIHVANETIIPAGKRFWLEWVGDPDGGGNDPVVRIYNGTSKNHLSVPVAGDVLALFLQLATVTAQGDTLYATAASVITNLAKGTGLQLYRMNAGATAPEWASGIQISDVPSDIRIKAWVLFDGRGGSITPDDDYNIDSITDNGGVGNYQSVWDVDFASINYVTIEGCDQFVAKCDSFGTGSCRCITFNTTLAAADSDLVRIIAIGDQ